jgi:hypothetical protein
VIDNALIRAPHGRPPSVVVNPSSWEALGPSLRTVVISANPASAIYPTANLSFGYPISLSQPITVASMYVINGTVVSGNIDLGIYDDAGNLLVSKGSTAQAGTSVKQILDTTDLVLYPGNRYYVFVSCDNVTATMFRWTPTVAGLLAASGMVQVASNFPLATGVTFALMANAYLPVFGYSQLATY